MIMDGYVEGSGSRVSTNYKKVISILREITVSEDWELMEKMLYDIAAEDPEIVVKSYEKYMEV